MTIITLDPITEAWTLCARLEMAMIDVTEMGERRIRRILARAHARLQRREFAELDSACGGFGCVDGCGDCCAACELPGHAIQACPDVRAALMDAR